MEPCRPSARQQGREIWGTREKKRWLPLKQTHPLLGNLFLPSPSPSSWFAWSKVNKGPVWPPRNPSLQTAAKGSSSECPVCVP